MLTKTNGVNTSRSHGEPTIVKIPTPAERLLEASREALDAHGPALDQYVERRLVRKIAARVRAEKCRVTIPQARAALRRAQFERYFSHGNTA